MLPSQHAAGIEVLHMAEDTSFVTYCAPAKGLQYQPMKNENKTSWEGEHRLLADVLKIADVMWKHRLLADVQNEERNYYLTMYKMKKGDELE